MGQKQRLPPWRAKVDADDHLDLACAAKVGAIVPMMLLFSPLPRLRRARCQQAPVAPVVNSRHASYGRALRAPRIFAPVINSGPASLVREGTHTGPSASCSRTSPQ